MLETIRKLIQNDSVPIVHVEGNEKITKLQWVGNIQKNPNSVQDPFSLNVYEIHSDRVQFFFRGISRGWGYICDIAGPTVNIDRKITGTMPDLPGDGEQNSEKPEGLSITGEATRIKAPVLAKNTKFVLVPCVVLKGKDKIQEVHFEYMEQTEDVLLLERTKTRWIINPDSTIEIVMPDGKSQTGWICDESGQTLKLSRNVVVMGVLRDRKGNPVMDATGTRPIEVELGINWSGRLGKGMTNDKLTLLWATVVSGKEKLIFGVFCFLIGQAIFAVFRI